MTTPSEPGEKMTRRPAKKTAGAGPTKARRRRRLEVAPPPNHLPPVAEPTTLAAPAINLVILNEDVFGRNGYETEGSVVVLNWADLAKASALPDVTAWMNRLSGYQRTPLVEKALKQLHARLGELLKV